MNHPTTRRIAVCGIVGGLYAAVTVLTSAFSYGPLQFRIAEALTVLCCFDPTITVGLTLGCLIANLFSTVSALDLVIGTAATLIACLATARIRSPWLLPLPATLANGLLVGAELAWTLAPETFWSSLLLYGGQVALGELAVMTVLGIPLHTYGKKRRFGAKS